MNQESDIQSLSRLPSPDVIEFEGSDHFKITLPVYCLSFFKSTSWKATGPAFLIFTDFTTVHNSAIEYGLLSSKIPRDYFLEDGLQSFDTSKLFSTSVPAFKCAAVVKEFRKFKKPVTNDFSHELDCRFEQQGVFMNINMTLKTYRGKIESNFNSLTLLSDENIEELYPPKSPNRHILINLLKIFKDTVSPSIYERASQILPIESILSSFPGSSNTRRRSFAEPPHKVQKRPNGMNLLFQQHTSTDDSQRPISSQSQTQFTQSDVSRSMQYTNCIGVNLEEFDTFLVNKVNVSQILQIAPKLQDLKKEKILEVDVYIRGMLPMQPFIVKPYKRTLKVAPFKLVVRDESCESDLFLEFLTDDEICSFLEIIEIEQILHQYEDINATFEKLISNPSLFFRGIKIKRSLDAIHPTIMRPYWTCTSTIKDMLNYGRVQK